MISKRQIEFQWYMHYNCNYRCQYCYFLKDKMDAKKDTYLSLNEWAELWDRIYGIYGSVKIHLTGGEPSVYPSFVELVKKLSEKHAFKIYTNLSGDFERFSREIDPSRICGGIIASFHPVHARFDEFLKKALLLKTKGFFVYIAYVAYPPQLKQMRYYINKFKDAGLQKFMILPYRKSYQDTSCYDYYSDEERKLILDIMDELKLDNAAGDLKKCFTVDLNLGKEKTKDNLCSAGQFYAVIDSDGKVTRCKENGSIYLGNFITKDFKLLDKPLSCDDKNCFCEFKRLAQENKSENVVNKVVVTNSVHSKKHTLKLSHPYKVFFNWDVHYSCNYRCSYCFFDGRWEEVAKENIYPGIHKWIDVWQRMYKKYGSCCIDISGGEPSTYPSFLELVVELSKMHDIRISTNLSFDVEIFAKNMLVPIKERGQSAVMINPSFKPGRVRLEDFLAKVIFLQKEGFKISVTYVGYPPHLNDMKETKEKFENSNIEFTIQPFRGKYNGRIYPDSYSEAEKNIFSDCYNNDPPPLVKYFVGDNVRKEKKLCRMGQVYAKISPNGETYRCCAVGGARLGNIINDNDFLLLEEPVHCDLACPCWKAMIAGEEDKWLKHWK